MYMVLCKVLFRLLWLDGIARIDLRNRIIYVLTLRDTMYFAQTASFIVQYHCPMKVPWQLQQPASSKFIADVHSLLQSKRVPVEEIGMIFRQIDKEL